MLLGVGLPICFVLTARPDEVSNQGTLMVAMLRVMRCKDLAVLDHGWIVKGGLEVVKEKENRLIPI